jgi:Grx4 family monothiol glutaredoxin
VHFTGEWAKQHSAQINDVVEELIKSKLHNSKALQVSVDALPELAQKYQIDCVPTVVLFAKQSPVDKVEGVGIPALVNKVNEVSIKHFPLTASLDGVSKQVAPAKVALEDRLKQLIEKAPLMIFIKGNRDAPRCGFSKQLVELLGSVNAEYESFDILSDEEVRQGLKTYSNWPTYPQVYFKSELLGGIDIIRVSDGSRFTVLVCIRTNFNFGLLIVFFSGNVQIGRVPIDDQKLNEDLNWSLC